MCRVCEAALAPRSTRGHPAVPRPPTPTLTASDPVRPGGDAQAAAAGLHRESYDATRRQRVLRRPAAARFEHRVAGKWTRTADWPHVSSPAASLPHVRELYGSALATFAAAFQEHMPERGRLTPRLFEEAVLARWPSHHARHCPFRCLSSQPRHCMPAPDSRRPTVSPGWLDIACNCPARRTHRGLALTCSCFPVVPPDRALDQILGRLTDARSPRVRARRSSWPLGLPGPVAIIGCGGSGKSRLARALAATLGITPVAPDGRNTTRTEAATRSSSRTGAGGIWWPRAVDHRRQLRLHPRSPRKPPTQSSSWTSPPGPAYGSSSTSARHGGGSTNSIGVYDRITWKFIIRYIAGYRKQMAPRVRSAHAGHAGGHLVVCCASLRAAGDTSRGLAARSAAAPGVAAVRTSANPFNRSPRRCAAPL